MENTLSTLKKQWPQLVAIIVICGVFLPIFFAYRAPKHPELAHYFIAVTSPVSHEEMQQARVALEDSLFESVNELISQDQSLTYSEALDNILPVHVLARNSPSGIVVVIKNWGRVATHHLQGEIHFGAPLENYKVVGETDVSVLVEDLPKGVLKISVDELAPKDELQIVALFKERYEVFLTASRTVDLEPPMAVASEVNTMKQVQSFATQTAVAIYNQTNVDGLLQFNIQNAVDDIQPTVLVSSEETTSYLLANPGDIERERNLFFEIFQP